MKSKNAIYIIFFLIVLFSAFIVFLIVTVSSSPLSQTRIKMQKENGVYYLPCKVNGLDMKFIFDTGASDVSISLSEAVSMIDNGSLSRKDIIGPAKAQLADGRIIENTKVVLREIEVVGLKLYNVEATVIHNMEAPLLLGQSVISRLGKIQLDGDVLTITSKTSDNSSSRNWTRFNIRNVLLIDIPSTLELRDKESVIEKVMKNQKLIHKIKSNKDNYVFQPVGLNNLQSTDVYSRIIINIGDLYTKESELNELSKEELTELMYYLYKNCITQAKEYNIPIQRKYKPQLRKIGNADVIDIYYIRGSAADSDSSVSVHIYYIIRMDKLIEITMSFREKESHLWESDFKEIVKSFRFI